MYVLCECIASEGNYVVHRKTGEIKYARSVDSCANVLIDEVYCECGMPEWVYWDVNEYFVLEKIAGVYYNGHFDQIKS
ncbi:hypothetical protein [Salinibacillus xinjiangensis]|uniref:Uncharacterized protein n=1 Tax=Salinibacillus xinjiangensis TaxID=1229268 RepID=A0A6G1X6T0_9BACI|nr:hypothetical protein [Salinibacillus xinjiangensis]MRG86711.1 hypothetical protein [Salinibacillus xinjiangensis]